jgi:hypothetical protein
MCVLTSCACASHRPRQSCKMSMHSPSGSPNLESDVTPKAGRTKSVDTGTGGRGELPASALCFHEGLGEGRCWELLPTLLPLGYNVGSNSQHRPSPNPLWRQRADVGSIPRLPEPVSTDLVLPASEATSDSRLGLAHLMQPSPRLQCLCICQESVLPSPARS